MVEVVKSLLFNYVLFSLTFAILIPKQKNRLYRETNETTAQIHSELEKTTHISENFYNETDDMIHAELEETENLSEQSHHATDSIIYDELEETANLSEKSHYETDDIIYDELEETENLSEQSHHATDSIINDELEETANLSEKYHHKTDEFIHADKKSKENIHVYHTVHDAQKEMGPFYARLMEVTDTSFTFKLSFDKIIEKIQFYEFIILKLNQDVDGIPRLTKIDSERWENFISYTEKPKPEQPYIAARYKASTLSREFTFTAGDSQHLGGYFNGPLQPGGFYVIFLRGTKREGDQTVHMSSDYISDPETPQFPLYFHTNTRSNAHLMRLGVGLGVAAILITATVIGMVANVGIFGRVRRGMSRVSKSTYRKSYKYKKVGDSQSGSSSDSNIDSQSQLVVSKRDRKRNLKKQQKRCKSKTVRKARKPIIITHSKQEREEPLSNPSHAKIATLKVPTKQVRSRQKSSEQNVSPSSRKEHKQMTIHVPSQVISDQVQPKQNTADQSASAPATPRPIVPTLDVSKIDVTPRINTEQSSFVNPASTNHSLSPAIRTYSVPDSPGDDLTLTTPRENTDMVQGKIREDRITPRDEDIWRRMSVYRWLVRLKHEGHLPASTEVNQVLEGEFSVPEHILDRYKDLLSKDTLEYFKFKD